MLAAPVSSAGSVTSLVSRSSVATPNRFTIAPPAVRRRLHNDSSHPGRIRLIRQPLAPTDAKGRARFDRRKRNARHRPFAEKEPLQLFCQWRPKTVSSAISSFWPPGAPRVIKHASATPSCSQVTARCLGRLSNDRVDRARGWRPTRVEISAQQPDARPIIANCCRWMQRSASANALTF